MRGCALWRTTNQLFKLCWQAGSLFQRHSGVLWHKACACGCFTGTSTIVGRDRSTLHKTQYDNMTKDVEEERPTVPHPSCNHVVLPTCFIQGECNVR